jgi:hypothetical protein
MSEKTFQEKIVELQSRVRVTKDQFNSFGKYSYWTVGDILAEARPIANELGLILYIEDQIAETSGRFYVKAIATISDGKEKIVGQAFAREALEKKGMDEAQVTGAASSYARKYCLAGLLGLDGEKDSDATNTHDKAQQRPQAPNINASVGAENPASEKQVNLIKSLCEQVGEKMPVVNNSKHASILIERLNELRNGANRKPRL